MKTDFYKTQIFISLLMTVGLVCLFGYVFFSSKSHNHNHCCHHNHGSNHTSD